MIWPLPPSWLSYLCSPWLTALRPHWLPSVSWTSSFLTWDLCTGDYFTSVWSCPSTDLPLTDLSWPPNVKWVQSLPHQQGLFSHGRTYHWMLSSWFQSLWPWFWAFFDPLIQILSKFVSQRIQFLLKNLREVSDDLSRVLPHQKLSPVSTKEVPPRHTPKEGCS